MGWTPVKKMTYNQIYSNIKKLIVEKNHDNEKSIDEAENGTVDIEKSPGSNKHKNMKISPYGKYFYIYKLKLEQRIWNSVPSQENY